MTAPKGWSGVPQAIVDRLSRAPLSAHTVSTPGLPTSASSCATVALLRLASRASSLIDSPLRSRSRRTGCDRCDFGRENGSQMFATFGASSPVERERMFVRERAPPAECGQA